MRVLLDENIDRLLKELFAARFEVITVRERGWQGKAGHRWLAEGILALPATAASACA